MNRIGSVVQIAFTYIGTIVGAGFATGQEILQFYTRYGRLAALTIAVTTVFFIWLGTKLLLAAADSGTESYEELNKQLFGEKVGKAIGLFMLFVLFGTTTVMLAGAGSLFREHLQLPYQTGLLVTLLVAYLVLARGIKAILSVNTVVVPIMLAFTGCVVWAAWHSPGSNNWILRATDEPLYKIWASPLLYAAFNLATAQAVLVPLGAAIRDRKALIWGGVLGGAGIGVLLFACHYALSAQMPGVTQYEIPMGHLVSRLGPLVRMLYAFVIFGEIFTTFVADGYGLVVQLEQRTGWSRHTVLIGVLMASYAVSLVGFSKLLSILYPLFGLVSLLWFAAMLWCSRPARPSKA